MIIITIVMMMMMTMMMMINKCCQDIFTAAGRTISPLHAVSH